MFFTGVQAGSSTPSATFMTTLDPLLVSAGFEFIEQYAASGVTARIYRSPSTANYFARDWYLLVRRLSDTAPQVYFGVCELYDSATHRMRNYAPYHAAANMTPTSEFAVNDAPGKTPDSQTGPPYLSTPQFGVPAVGFKYALSLTPDRIVTLMMSSSFSVSTYVGLYDDFLPVSISPFPLMVIDLAYYTGNFDVGACTREPATTTSVAKAFALDGLGVPGNNASVWSPPQALEFYTQKMWLSRVPIASARSTTAERGLLRDVWWAPTTDAQVSAGDTLVATINGVRTVLMKVGPVTSGASSQYYVDTETAP